jgi:hypothetical protein
MQWSLRKKLAAAALLAGVLGSAWVLSTRARHDDGSSGSLDFDAASIMPATDALRPAVSEPVAEATVRLALGDALPEATVQRAWEDGLLERGDPWLIGFTLNRIALAQAKAGAIDRARATLRMSDQTAVRVASPYFRRSALLRVAVARARSGATEIARETFERLIRATASESRSERVRSLTDIAGFQDRVGLRGDGLRTFKLAQGIAEHADKDEWSSSQTCLMRGYLDLSDFSGALALAAQFKGRQSNLQAHHLGEIALRTEHADRATARETLARALEMSRSVTYEYPRALAQAQIAGAMARNGEIADALKAARGIGQFKRGPFPSIDERLRPMAAIAAAQARAGDSAGAKATLSEAFHGASGMQDDIIRSDRLREIAETYATLGDPAAARRAIAAIRNDDVERAKGLIAIARQEIQAGDEPAGRSTFREAIAAAVAITIRPTLIGDNPATNRDEAIHAIAVAQAETGDIAGALATVAAHCSSDGKPGTLAALAPLQAAGDVSSALATANQIVNAGKRAEVLAAIARVQARAGKASEVLDWIDRLESPDARWTALLGVVDGALAQRAEAKP